MRARDAALVSLLALALAPAPAAAQASGFNGRYALKLSFGPSCRAGVPAVTVPLFFAQSAAVAGAEIDGRPVATGESFYAQALLLYASARLRGAFASKGGRTDRDAVSTSEGLLLAPWLMLDGTVTAGSGRPSARGSAFGYAAVGTTTEEVPTSLASCTASDFSWTLDPQ